MSHPHPKGNFVPKAAVSFNIAKPINIAYPRPTVNSARKASNVLNKAHTHVRRPFNKSTTNKNSNLKEKVNTVKGDALRSMLRVPFNQRNNPPPNPRVVYPPILDINHFCHFLVILENLYLMDDEPMWAADHVVVPTPGSVITIPETENEFAIKALFDRLLGEIQAISHVEDKVLLKLDWAKNQKTKSTLKKTIAFADGDNSNSDTDKIMARMDAMTLKMDTQYKELRSKAKKTKTDLDEDDIPMSYEEEAKLADKQSGRPSGSLPSNTQPNPKGPQLLKPLKAIEILLMSHVNAVLTRSGKSYVRNSELLPLVLIYYCWFKVDAATKD
ncbi:hypothetical protein Tco_0791026 [Tanacetum coccineum]